MSAGRHTGSGRIAECGLKTVAAFDLVSLGEPLYELNRQTTGHFLPGTGGDTLNVAIAAARLGSRCAYVTKLGADFFAAEIRETMQREAIDVSTVGHHPAAPTGLYFVTHGPSGHDFTYRRAGSAASMMTPADLDPKQIASSRILHASGISQAISSTAAATVAAAIGIARSNGVEVSFDTNYRPRLWPAAEARSQIEQAAAQADILKTSLEDCAALLQLSEPGDISRHFMALGARAVIVTLGREGAVLTSADGTVHLPGKPVAAVDATGAGDAFMGALLAERARAVPLAQAAAFANMAAALSTMGFGAIAPLPRRAAVEAALVAESSTA